MAPTAQRPKLVAIVGPTASGKSNLAIKIAQEFGGEIICADSRTVYKAMDIGTAKPSKKDRAKVKHWGLDLVELNQRFTVADFKKYAEHAIEDIQNRDKLPILVGGAGLYIDSVLFNFSFRRGNRLSGRLFYSQKTIEELQAIIRKKGYPMPKNMQNKRHLTRTIESEGQTGSKQETLQKDVILVGILPPNEVLKQNIDKRLEKVFTKGILVETVNLLERYGEEALCRSTGVAYKACLDLINGGIDYPGAIMQAKMAEWQYARRQKTWFKRNKFIHWFKTPEQAYKFLRSDLAKR
ncbi:tRNA (adenosine(37)-N6)-dimethylallyltransferase MiaA [Candidatus Saccharibacteria bacterium]|nr:tRNA (adenosine(37)-N6)-dimethylallyltransferase MiaA [Candidatus Saccharibacteria bacterium]